MELRCPQVRDAVEETQHGVGTRPCIHEVLHPVLSSEFLCGWECGKENLILG